MNPKILEFARRNRASVTIDFDTTRKQWRGVIGQGTYQMIKVYADTIDGIFSALALAISV